MQTSLLHAKRALDVEEHDRAEHIKAAATLKQAQQLHQRRGRAHSLSCSDRPLSNNHSKLRKIQSPLLLGEAPCSYHSVCPNATRAAGLLRRLILLYGHQRGWSGRNKVLCVSDMDVTFPRGTVSPSSKQNFAENGVRQTEET